MQSVLSSSYGNTVVSSVGIGDDLKSVRPTRAWFSSAKNEKIQRELHVGRVAHVRRATLELASFPFPKL